MTASVAISDLKVTSLVFNVVPTMPEVDYSAMKIPLLLVRGLRLAGKADRLRRPSTWTNLSLVGLARALPQLLRIGLPSVDWMI